MIKDLYSIKGRHNRRQFITFYFFPLLVAIPVSLIASIIYFLFDPGPILLRAINLLVLLLLILAFPVQIASIIKRFHDLNKSGTYITYLFIPLVNFYFVFCLFIEKGTEGENDFGVPQQ